MATDNGPKRDVSPAPIPSYTKPDPHFADDPGPPPADVPYVGNVASPIRGYHFDEEDAKAWGKGRPQIDDDYGPYDND